MAEVSLQLFDKASADLDELKKGFHDHEKKFSEFMGASEERYKTLFEYVKRQDALGQMITDHQDRLIKLETERDSSRRHTKIWISVAIAVGTLMPIIIRLIWG